MWNPFKKTTQTQTPSTASADDITVLPVKKDEKPEEPQLPKMNMLQSIAMKKMQKMSPAEQQKMMAEAFNPKNRDKMLSVMETMRKAGQISQEQYDMAIKKMGM
jgi:hypothetical protein